MAWAQGFSQYDEIFAASEGQGSEGQIPSDFLGHLSTGEVSSRHQHVLEPGIVCSDAEFVKDRIIRVVHMTLLSQFPFRITLSVGTSHPHQAKNVVTKGHF